MSAQIAAAVAAEFDLGVANGDLIPVTGGRVHRLWRLETSAGSWAVKALNRSREQWWLDAYLVAAEIEALAFSARISMPQPTPPRHAVAPLLADIEVDGELSSFRVHRWCAGETLTEVDVSKPVLRWVGETLAALHSLAPSRRAAGLPTFEPHDVAEWREWLDDAPAGEREFAAAAREFLPDIARAKAVVDNARSHIKLLPVLTHRDVKPDNVLLAGGSPVLLDWDEAGVDFAQWELIRAALAFRRSTTGWRRGSFVQVVRSYENLSGRRTPRDPALFAGVLRHQLLASAFLLWRALGHRPITPAERAAAHPHALEFLAQLRVSLDQIKEWTSWLPSD